MRRISLLIVVLFIAAPAALQANRVLAVPPPPGAWSAAAPMPGARTGHTATLLLNGRVLVAGGDDGTDVLATASIYSPATNTWSSAGSMISARRDHEAILLRNGRVLVYGGELVENTPLQSLQSAEIYDPGTNMWTAAAPMSAMHPNSSPVLLGDGRVLVAGGGHGPFSAVETYDPTTDTWTQHVNLPQNRGYYAASLLPDGRALLSGGSYWAGLLSGPHLSALIWDPTTATTTSMGVPCAHGGEGLWTFSRFGTNPIDAALTIVSATYLEYLSLHPIGQYSPCYGTPPVPVALAQLAGGGGLIVARQSDGGPQRWTGTELDVPTGAPVQDTSTTATLLKNGRVLATGGPAGNNAQLYDPGASPEVDVDGDGYNDGLELELEQHPWTYCNTMRADITGDGGVSSLDLMLTARAFGQTPAVRANQNGDNAINATDLSLVAQRFGQSPLMCP